MNGTGVSGTGADGRPPFPGRGWTARRWWIVGGSAGFVLLLLVVLVVKAPWRRSGLSLSRYSPVAAELEGVRGVYLYYPLPNSDSLVAEYRDVVVKDHPVDQVRAIFRELITGPSGNRASPFPEGTELLNTYWTQRGTLYLDWNRALVSGFRGGTGRERQLLGSIVRSAVDNLPEVQRVAILVEGSPVETIGGHYDTLQPLEAEDWR
jgi:spore germination protein GerM